MKFIKVKNYGIRGEEDTIINIDNINMVSERGDGTYNIQFGDSFVNVNKKDADTIFQHIGVRL